MTVRFWWSRYRPATPDHRRVQTDGRPQYHTCLTKDGLQSICTMEVTKGFGYLSLLFVRLSLLDNVKDPHSEVLPNCRLSYQRWTGDRPIITTDQNNSHAQQTVADISWTKTITITNNHQIFSHFQQTHFSTGSHDHRGFLFCWTSLVLVYVSFWEPGRSLADWGGGGFCGSKVGRRSTGIALRKCRISILPRLHFIRSLEWTEVFQTQGQPCKHLESLSNIKHTFIFIHMYV